LSLSFFFVGIFLLFVVVVVFCLFVCLIGFDFWLFLFFKSNDDEKKIDCNL